MKNMWDNYWYKTSDNSYIYAGDVSCSLIYDTPSTSGLQYPKGNRTVGQSLTLRGTLKTTYINMTSVGCFVYAGSATSGTAKTGGWATGLNTKSFSIAGTNADNKCKIGSLAAGSYTYVIRAKLENHYATDGKTMKTETKELIVFTNAFSEGQSTTYYTITYNANGGSSTPTSQSKASGTTVTLAGTISRDSTSGTGYSVTLNANGGTVSPTYYTTTSTTNYSFRNWNTEANGSGTSYSAGGSYSANANVTLYAQWDSTTTNSSIVLPTPTRTGFSFMGWATSSGASSGVTGYYTPTSNVTLYAIWSANQYTIQYNANGGTGAPAAQTKIHDSALTLSTVKPSRANTAESGFIVTLNANGGSVNPATLTAARTTSYTFTNWNTKDNGTGTAYNAGGTYTPNSSVTLYAQWTSSVSVAPVSLPTPSRDGFTFNGWSTSNTATSGTTGNYTPAGNVTLYAIWTENQPAVRFTDVSNPGDYFYTPVYWAVDNGITSGTSATTFSPYNPCTRGQVMSFLWKANGSPVVGGGNPFMDVTPGDYFYNAVLWAVANGITNGTSSTTFGPYNTCTRGQVMTFLYKAMN